jgi:mannose-6-phosphate isomerase-like protein (cupin superfamily)
MVRRSILVRSARLFGAALVLVAVANLLHRVVMPPSPPDPATFPRAGDTFGSAAEGFMQEVVAVEQGWLTLRTRVAPRAPGPPVHVHRTFAETFTVESGEIAILLDDRTIRLRAGESYRIEPGVAHRPFNPTEQEAVIGGPSPAMPQTLGACLVQIYRFLDAAQGQMGPALGLRIAAMDSICDAHTPGVPVPAIKALQWGVLPFARLFGYRNYYPELALHQAERTASSASARPPTP